MRKVVAHLRRVALQPILKPLYLKLSRVKQTNVLAILFWNREFKDFRALLHRLSLQNYQEDRFCQVSIKSMTEPNCWMRSTQSVSTSWSQVWVPTWRWYVPITHYYILKCQIIVSTYVTCKVSIVNPLRFLTVFCKITVWQTEESMKKPIFQETLSDLSVHWTSRCSTGSLRDIEYAWKESENLTFFFLW